MIHAKGILVTRTDASEIALLGSPNLSAPALLRRASDGNVEVALIHEGQNLDVALFGLDSPFGLGGPADLERLVWEPDPTTTTPVPTLSLIRLVGARYEGGARRGGHGGDARGRCDRRRRPTGS